MYGTVARIRVKTGMEGQFRQLIEGQCMHLKLGRYRGS